MEEIDKNKKLYILLGVLLIAIFAISINLLKGNKDGNIDYDKITSGQDLLNSATVVYDRKIYYTLDSIISKYIMSLDGYVNEKNEYVKYEEYYNALSSTYKKVLSKNEYEKVADKFLNKFVYFIEAQMESQRELQTQNVIRKIYEIEEDMYVCVVGREASEIIGYIGIRLNTSDNIFEIFYLE